MPRLSIATFTMPSEDVFHCVQLGVNWWGIAARTGVLNGELIPAYVARMRTHPIWPTLIAVFDADPLTEPHRVAALYPPPLPAPTHLIPDMEEADILARWPDAFRLRL